MMDFRCTLHGCEAKKHSSVLPEGAVKDYKHNTTSEQ